jgi:hypothetical protein
MLPCNPKLYRELPVHNFENVVTDFHRLRTMFLEYAANVLWQKNRAECQDTSLHTVKTVLPSSSCVEFSSWQSHTTYQQTSLVFNISQQLLCAKRDEKHVVWFATAKSNLIYYALTEQTIWIYPVDFRRKCVVHASLMGLSLIFLYNFVRNVFSSILLLLRYEEKSRYSYEVSLIFVQS